MLLYSNEIQTFDFLFASTGLVKKKTTQQRQTNFPVAQSPNKDFLYKVANQQLNYKLLVDSSTQNFSFQALKFDRTESSHLFAPGFDLIHRPGWGVGGSSTLVVGARLKGDLSSDLLLLKLLVVFNLKQQTARWITFRRLFGVHFSATRGLFLCSLC